MANLLSDGATWLAAKLKASAATTISYRRPAVGSDLPEFGPITISATMCSQLMKTSDREGNAKYERPDADFVFTAADLDFGGVVGVKEPKAGDLIDVTAGGVTKRYKAMPVNNGREPAWRYCDPFQTMVRVHTKLEGTV